MVWITFFDHDKMVELFNIILTTVVQMTGVIPVPRELWQKCMEILQDELPSQQFNTWLRPLKVMSDEDEVCLLAPNRFVLDWVKDKYLKRIEELFMELSGGEPPSIALGVSNRRPTFGGFRGSRKTPPPKTNGGGFGGVKKDEDHGQTNLDLVSDSAPQTGATAITETPRPSSAQAVSDVASERPKERPQTPLADLQATSSRSQEKALF